MIIRNICIGILLASFTITCESQEKVTHLSNRIALLEDSLSTLESRIYELDGKIWQLNYDKLIEELDKIAILYPGTDGYSSIKSDLGVLTVILDNVKPYANGSQVTLRWGNILNTTIDGLNMKIDYGSVDNGGNIVNENAKSRDYKMSKSLLPGSWNNVDVVLEGVRPENLGFIRINDLNHSGIRLKTN